MLLKVGFKILVLGLEIFLGIYSMVLSDSLLIKFLFFVFSAIIVAFAVTKITNSLLPSDKDYISPEPAMEPREETKVTEK